MSIKLTQRFVKSRAVLAQDLLDGDSVLLHVDSGQYFGLDRVGNEAWKILANGATLQDACDRLLDQFDVAPDQLQADLTALINEGRRVVLSADRPPAALTEVDARLRSYRAAGLVCGVEAADKSLRQGIVQRKLEILAARQMVDLPARPEVTQFLADREPGSIRELEGARNTLVAGAGSRLSRISLEEAQGLLQPNLRGGVERRITVDEIQKVTSDHFSLKQADLLSERRTRSIARPRQIAMYLCKQLTTRSYPDIGRRFGGRDHTTVLHAVKKIDELMGTDEQIARDVEALTRKLRG